MTLARSNKFFKLSSKRRREHQIVEQHNKAIAIVEDLPLELKLMIFHDYLSHIPYPLLFKVTSGEIDGKMPFLLEKLIAKVFCENDYLICWWDCAETDTNLNFYANGWYSWYGIKTTWYRWKMFNYVIKRAGVMHAKLPFHRHGFPTRAICEIVPQHKLSTMSIVYNSTLDPH
ncbi:unnamed protein product [Ambrosiozyma monospora]|uniref:Unnamed protein product n=1 Tax=Ambrosiozyma monospora TaxID=43982 RepID=A0ACB5TVF7_AMBMO|nr:unnamed protein product [Ambrosiozyma monospora]